MLQSIQRSPDQVSGETTQGSYTIHQQTSAKVEVSNREIKAIFGKWVNANQTDWETKLDDSLWVYRKTF